eukprot:8475468-Karenia_brevis.AAC.1
MQLISAHAPCEGAHLSDKEAFWNSLTALCSKLRRQAPAAAMWLFIDANGRVGLDDDGACGACDPDEISDNGQ